MRLQLISEAVVRHKKRELRDVVNYYCTIHKKGKVGLNLTAREPRGMYVLLEEESMFQTQGMVWTMEAAA